MKLLARIGQLTLGLVAGLVVVFVATALPTSPRPVLAATNCDVADFSLDAHEQAFLTLINSYRTQNGLATLSASPTLNRASVWMAADMAAFNYFDHTDRLGRQWDQRMAQCDVARVGPAIWSENIAAWYDTAASVFDGWKNSPGHNTNMLNPNFRSIGIGRVASTLPTAGNTTPGFYWVTDFSNEVVAGPPPPPPPPTPCANPTLTSNPNATGVTVANTMTFTAGVTGCTTPSYLWWVHDGATWAQQGTWTPTNTFSWTPAAPGSYFVAFWAKQENSLAAQEASLALSRTVVAPVVACANPTLVSNPAATTLAANTTMTFTAAVTSCAPANYLWWVHDGANWAQQGTWTTNNTFTWTPTAPGNYYVAFWAKHPGSPSAQDTSIALAKVVTASATACANPGLTSNPNVPSLKANTTMTFTATVTGCNPANYLWWVHDGVTWIQQGTLTTANTFTWTPTVPGSYYVAFWAKNPSSPSVQDTSFAIVRTVTP